MTKQVGKKVSQVTGRRRGLRMFPVNKRGSNSNFANRVYSVVREIPKGEVMTYAQVAAVAGSPGAHRAVGNILKRNYDPKIPCHRVIHTDGSLGDYNRGGPKIKLKILKHEKAIFR